MGRLPSIDFDELQRLFSYDPVTGVLTREVSYSNRVKAGSQAGTIKSVRKGGNQYLQVQVMGKGLLYVHVIAYVLMTGVFPSKHLDHKNGNGLDNRWNNLRLATNGENMANSGPKSTKKSGLPKGVFYRKNDGYYVAKLCNRAIKYSKSLEVAKAAYDAAARAKYGEFARL